MKKLLLFSLAIGFALFSVAQTDMQIKKNSKRVQDGQEIHVVKPNHSLILKESKSVDEDVTRIIVGKAGHQRGIRREEAHVVDYNAELDVISVASILDPETYDYVDQLGIVGIWYSYDRGQTWSDPIILNDDLSQGPNYYLSGGLFNPPGNTSVENMYGVHQGTIYPTAGDWRFKVFGSSTLAGDNLTTYMDEQSEYDGYFNIFGLNQFGNEMRCMNLKTYGTWSSFSEIQLQVIVGEFGTTDFDWDYSNLIDAEFYVGSDGIVEWTGMYVGMDAGAEIAWSDDGQIGYIWVVGVSDNDASGYQPMVFKTEDAGNTWDYIYLDFMDNDMQDILEDYLIPATGGDFIPHVPETAGVVDGNGDLQMLVAMGSTSADVFTYPDSIGYHWVYPGDLFNITVDGDGIKELMWVDSLRTENVEQDSEGAYCGSEGWQHRISAAKSPDEMQVFFTWIDTRDNETNEFNVDPDLFGWSRGVCDNPLTMDETVCFSEGTEMEELFWFNTAADNVYLNDEGTWTLPCVQGVSPPEFYGNSSTSEDPITLSYITGIEFPILCPVGIEEQALNNRINVSQNMPNPFTGSTTIEVSTNSAEFVTVEVSNIMGQSIYVVNAGTINGTKNIELSAENLDGGIYFYTVRVGSESITKKMIVE